jgi:hypothetical protein
MAESKRLKWGKMRVWAAPVTALGTDAWAEIFTPVKDSFALNVEAGNKLEAFIEGGERLAVRQDASKFAFEFQVYIAENLPKPIPDEDGLITAEYAVRVVPEDVSQAGFLMERAAVSVVESFTSEEGHRATYTFEALKPETGKMVKTYYWLPVTPDSLVFTNAADTTGKTVTVTATGTVTATSSQTWATVTIAGSVVTVKVTANATGVARTATVTITADGKTAAVTVTQTA